MSKRGKGMSKSKKSAPKQAEKAETPAQEADIPGGEREYTLGKDDAPIILTRTDPNFEARERLAEQLWEREKGNLTFFGEEEAKEDEESPDQGEEETEDEPEAAEEDTGDVQEEEEAPESGEVDVKAEEDEEDTLIIDGQQTKKSKKEIYEAGKRALQKDLSADKRLEEATRLLREAQSTVQAQLSAQDAQAGARNLQPVPTGDQKKRIQDLYEKLRYGSDEEGTDALTEVLGGRTATPQLNDILYNVGLYLERDRIRHAFMTPPDEGGYADIYPTEQGGLCEDPEVWDYFDFRVNKALQSGSPNELATYRKAAEAVRQRFAMKADTPKASLEEKKAKKREIDVVKGVKKKAPPVEVEKEETHEDILRWHRKNRGQL